MKSASDTMRRLIDHDQRNEMKSTARYLRVATRAGVMVTLVAAVLCLAFAGTAFAGWNSQTSNTTEDLNNLTFADASTGWAVGTNGTIVATSDGGTTWASQDSGVSLDLCGIDAVSATTAWTVGDHGTILKTMDGGQTWTPQESGSTALLLSVDFVNDTTGYVVGDTGVILKTIDGGSTWNSQASDEPASITLAAVSFRDPSHGIAVGDMYDGGSGSVLVTSDGGSTWTAVHTPVAQTLYDVQNMDATHAWAVGCDGTVLQSADDGATWTERGSSTHYDLYAVRFANADDGWAVGTPSDVSPKHSTIRKTTDGGETWTTESTTSFEYLYGLAVTSRLVATAAGSAGTILSLFGDFAADTTPPSTTDDAPVGWVNHAVTVGLVAVDGESGVKQTFWTLDGGLQQTGTSVPVSGEGPHTIVYHSVDNAGRVEPDNSCIVRIDTTKPATADDAPSGWQDGPVDVTLTPSDLGGAGVADTQYRLDGGVLVSGTTVHVAGDGVHHIEYSTTDGAGNSELTKTCDVQIDGNPPVTVDDAPAGWSNADVTVRLSATDDGSGVAHTYYSVDGVDGVPTSGGVTDVTVSGEGVHSVVYYSEDKSGRYPETHHLAWVRIDTTKPVTTIEDGGAVVHYGPVQVTLSRVDTDGSGIASTFYSIDDGPLLTGTSFTVGAIGDHIISYYSTDNVGNVEDTKTVSVTISGTAPMTRDNAPVGWVNRDTQVILTPMTGADSIEYAIGSDSPPASWTQGPGFMVRAPADHSNDGVHLFTYHALTNGVAEAVDHTSQVRIDTTAPVTANDVTSAWRQGSALVTLTATDAASGVAATAHRIDGGAWQSGASFTVEGDGVHAVEYSSTDNAGNTEAAKTVQLRVDGTAPTTTDNAPVAWQRSSTTVSFVASDSGSGAESTHYSVDGAAPQAGSSVVLSTDGSHTVSYYSIDRAGNIEAAKTCQVNIDTHAPLATGLKKLTLKRNTSARLTFMVTDAQPNGGPATVLIQIRQGKSATAKIVKAVTLLQQPLSRSRVWSFRCTLKKGTYTYYVSATDFAGNRQVKAAHSTLIVK